MKKFVFWMFVSVHFFFFSYSFAHSFAQDPDSNGPPPSETQKSETQKSETQKSETQKSETQKSETQKSETQKSETQKSETQKSETQKSETQKSETQKSETQKEDKNEERSNIAEKYGYFSSQHWSADQTTVTFDKDRVCVSGLRFIFEPNFGSLLQMGENEFDDKNFVNLSKFALETNLFKGWVALQFGVVSPSTIKFDPASPIVKQKSLVGSGDTVKVRGGLTVGFSFLDGWIVTGLGGLSYNKNNFVDCYKGNYHDGFIFLNLQPVSLIRSAIKAIRAIPDSK